MDSGLPGQARLGGARVHRVCCAPPGCGFGPARRGGPAGRARGVAPARMLSGLGRRREDQSPRHGAVGFLFVFLVWFFFFFFFDVCALTEAPVLRKRELAETSRTVQAQKRTGQNRGQLRGVGCPWGAATLSQEYKITTRVGMYAHLAYLLARSKCEK